MVEITKDEATEIRRRMPWMRIRKTRYKFYTEESRAVMRILAKMRASGVVAEYGR